MIAQVAEKMGVVKELCCKYHVKRLELFGSATNSDFSDTSDLDFLVEFQPGTNLGPWLSLYQDLKSDLEGVLGRKVDLVMAKALKNPYFIRQVNRSRELIYER